MNKTDETYLPRALSPRPSAAKRWTRCPAYPVLAQWVDDEPTFAPWLLEGTYAHKLGELCLSHGDDPADYLGEDIPCKIDEDTRFVRTDIFTPDRNMTDAVGEYVDYCRNQFEELKGRDQLGSYKVEQRVGTIFHKVSLVGTADFITLTPRVIAVTDLKFGENVEVEADNNEQIEAYLLAAFNRYRTPDDYKLLKELRATIVQPRLKSGGQTVKELVIKNPLEWVEEKKKKFDDAFRRIVSQQGRRLIYNPSVEGCMWCDASHFCGKFKEILKMIIRVKDFDVPDVDPEVVKLVAEFEGPVKDFMQSVRRFATNKAIGQGVTPRGMKLVEGGRAPSLAWVSAPRAAKALSSLVDLGEFELEDLFNMATPRTPTQVSKIIGADFVSKYAVRPSVDRPIILVPESDKRPAIATAKDDFSDLLDELDDDFDEDLDDEDFDI